MAKKVQAPAKRKSAPISKTSKKSAKSAPKKPAVLELAPQLCVRNAAKALEFYKVAFGAKELRRVSMPNSPAIMHAEMRIGDFKFYLNDEFPEQNALSPLAHNGTAVILHLQVNNADAVYERAVAAGAKVYFPIGDQFWGDRYGVVEDPFGHRWSIGAKIEDLTPSQMKRRMAQMAANPDWPKKIEA